MRCYNLTHLCICNNDEYTLKSQKQIKQSESISTTGESSLP